MNKPVLTLRVKRAYTTYEFAFGHPRLDQSQFVYYRRNRYFRETLHDYLLTHRVTFSMYCE